MKRLDVALESTLDPWRTHTGPIVVLFSGGVDSGLLGWELRHRPQTTLLTVGFPGAPDLEVAAGAAESIGLPWAGHAIDPSDLSRIEAQISEELAGVPARLQGVFLSLATAIRAAEVEEVLCGQGADELFLGYAHFRSLSEADAAERARLDLDRLEREDWPRAIRLASIFGRRLSAPFLDSRFVAAARSVPVGLRLPSPVPKSFLRAWARRRGVPSAIVDRPKKAMQFGTGVDRWLRARRVRDA